VELSPTHADALHYLGVLRHRLMQVCDPGQSPTPAPDDHVRAELDAFAGELDETLAGLSYRTPELLADLLD
jgi:predicted TPR repeat methyltransferase